jgi:3-dehydroquinate synthase
VKIRSHSKDYEVEIIESLMPELIMNDRNSLIVIDKIVYELYKDTLFSKLDNDRLFLFDAVENQKSPDSALAICKKMADLSFKRSNTLVSIGGGIVQDITGFAANIFNRGVRWVFIPTTLLAQCDSCIGGKTSLNFLGYKNMLGTFFAPDNIYIYLNFVNTLKDDDYLSGMGEVAKFNIMSAKDGIELLEKNMRKLLSRDIDTLKFFVQRSLEFKKTFIEEDEYDLGIRNLLNYAHTFGHAFEKVSNYSIPHGQAVTLGMITANNISCSRNMLVREMQKRIEDICLNFLSVEMRKEWFDTGKIVDAMRKDKKRKSDSLAAVLFFNDYTLKVVQDIEEKEVSTSLSNLTLILKHQNLIRNK